MVNEVIMTTIWFFKGSALKSREHCHARNRHSARSTVMATIKCAQCYHFKILTPSIRSFGLLWLPLFVVQMLQFLLIEFLRLEKKVVVGIRHRISGSYRDGKRNKFSSSECQQKCNIVNLTISIELCHAYSTQIMQKATTQKCVTKKHLNLKESGFQRISQRNTLHRITFNPHKIRLPFLFSWFAPTAKYFGNFWPEDKVRSHHPILVNEQCWSVCSFSGSEHASRSQKPPLRRIYNLLTLFEWESLKLCKW